MSLELIAPTNMPPAQMYTQVVIATGTKQVFISGQQPEDRNGDLLCRGDFAGQVDATFCNLSKALEAAGAQPTQVAKINIYIVDYDRDQHLSVIEKAHTQLFGDHKPANVIVGVAMMSPGYLVEVDAVAILD